VRDRPRLERRETGFSLAELLVFMALLGVVLTMAYAVSQAITTGQGIADRETFKAREITYPITRMSEILIQNSIIEPGPTAYSLSVRTDQDLNNMHEQHNFSIVTAGGDTFIQHTSFNLDVAGTRILPARFVHRHGSRITNAEAGVALFRYFDASGVEITQMGDVPTRARSVRITIRSTVEGRTISDSVDIVFRNRDM